MAAEKMTINSEKTLQEAIQRLTQDFHERKYLTLSLTYGKRRSGQQNNALHLYLRALCVALNMAGLDQRKVLKPGVDIPWTEQAAKEFLWRPIQKAVTGKESTTEPQTTDYPLIYDVLNRHMAEKFGIIVAWPTVEHGEQ